MEGDHDAGTDSLFTGKFLTNYISFFCTYVINCAQSPSIRTLEKTKTNGDELLSTILPPIYYTDLNKNTTTTISSTAYTPSPVKGWTSFFEEVQSCEFDDSIKQYPQLYFKNYNKDYDISNEEDFGKLLLTIEMKTFWVLHLEDNETLHEKYEKDLKRKESETILPNSGPKMNHVISKFPQQ
ncbi:95_t:CDS:2 [Entrophospora sp. SA101]|nr:95_t:CDS:2 [Entrophospora sp. SA101]